MRSLEPRFVLNATPELTSLAQALITPLGPAAATSDVTVFSEGVTIVSRDADNLEIRTGDQLSTALAATPVVESIAALNGGELSIIGNVTNDDVLMIDVDQFIRDEPAINFDGTIDFSGGNSVSDQDRLVLFDSNTATDDAFVALEYRFFVAAQDTGVINADGGVASANLQLRFDNVELIDQLVDTSRLDLVSSHRPDQFVIDHAATAGLNTVATVINDETGPLLTITNPRESLSIRGGQNTDQFTINSVDSGFTAALSLDGQEGEDTISISAALNLGSGNLVGNVDLQAESVLIEGSIATTAGNSDGTVTFSGGSTVNVSGNIDTGTSDVVVTDGAHLAGDGRIASNVVVQDSGVISSMNVGSLELRNDGRQQVQVNGPIAGVDYDQVVINADDAIDGVVTIDGGLLDLSLGFDPQGNNEFVLIDNDGNDAVNGRFRTLIGTDGSLLPAARVLEEGDVVLDPTSGISQTAYITYFGGDGNDVSIVTGGDLSILSQGVTLISRNGLNLEIRVGDTLAAAQAASPLIRPIASLNGQELKVIGTAPNDDSLYIDFDQFVDPDPQAINFDGTITFVGGNSASDQDQLVLLDSNPATDDAFVAMDYRFFVVAQESGVIVTDSGVASANLQLRFNDVELIDQLVDTNRLDFVGSHRPDQFVIDDAAIAGRNVLTTVINDQSGPLITITNPRELLSIRGGQSTDLIAINSADVGFTAAIRLDGQAGDDTISIAAALMLGSGNRIGDVDLQAESVLIDGSIDTTAGNIDGQVTFAGGSVVQVSGVIDTGSSDVIVSDSSRLEGDGRIESNVIVQNGGIIAPGTINLGSDTASLQVGSLQLFDSSVFEVQLDGSVAGSDYDQIVVDASGVDGSVMLGDALLDFSLGFVPGPDTEFVVISNDGTDNVDGRLRTLIGVDGSPLAERGDWKKAMSSLTRRSVRPSRPTSPISAATGTMLRSLPAETSRFKVKA